MMDYEVEAPEEIMPQDPRARSAWKKGAVAQRQNKPSSTCPYNPDYTLGNWYREAWLDGWRAARDKSKVKVIIRY